MKKYETIENRLTDKNEVPYINLTFKDVTIYRTETTPELKYPSTRNELIRNVY